MIIDAPSIAFNRATPNQPKTSNRQRKAASKAIALSLRVRSADRVHALSDASWANVYHGPAPTDSELVLAAEGQGLDVIWGVDVLGWRHWSAVFVERGATPAPHDQLRADVQPENPAIATFLRALVASSSSHYALPDLESIGGFEEFVQEYAHELPFSSYLEACGQVRQVLSDVVRKRPYLLGERDVDVQAVADHLSSWARCDMVGQVLHAWDRACVDDEDGARVAVERAGLASALLQSVDWPTRVREVLVPTDLFGREDLPDMLRDTPGAKAYLDAVLSEDVRPSVASRLTQIPVNGGGGSLATDCPD